MVTRLDVRSLSRPVLNKIEVERCSERPSYWAHILAVFQRVVNLVLPEGSVVALVLSEIGDGPFNVVVSGEAGCFAALTPGMPVRMDGTQLQVGNLELALSESTSIFEPLPDWHYLSSHCAEIERRLELCVAMALAETAQGTLLDIASGRRSTTLTDAESDLPSRADCRTTTSNACFIAAGKGARELRAGWDGHLVRLRAGAGQLAGLGKGLTPSGDDFLSGAMLWAWLAHPDPRSFCKIVLEVSASRTTTLSVALLRAAAAGECTAAWQRFLAGLADGTEGSIRDAIREVLSQGHTSGADTLAGFLWMGTRSAKPRRTAGKA